MRAKRFGTILLAIAAISAAATIASPPEPSDPKTPKPDSKNSNSTPKPATHGRAQLEKQFEEMMNGTVLSGIFQMTGPEGLEGKAPLSEPHAEKYTIETVKKLQGDHWLITARIQYADKDVRVPVPVRVIWAGDTPVITLDSIRIPMIGKYSARVMIHGKFYAGTWFGSNYGGVLSGQVVKQADLKALEAARPADEKRPAAPDPDGKPLEKPTR